MTIYMPQNPWAKMMPQLIGQMAMAKFQQSLRPEAEAEDYTLGPGQTRFRGKEKLGSLPPTEKEKKDKGTWSQLTPFKIGGATVYPQQPLPDTLSPFGWHVKIVVIISKE